MSSTGQTFGERITEEKHKHPPVPSRYWFLIGNDVPAAFIYGGKPGRIQLSHFDSRLDQFPRKFNRVEELPFPTDETMEIVRGYSAVMAQAIDAMRSLQEDEDVTVDLLLEWAELDEDELARTEKNILEATQIAADTPVAVGSTIGDSAEGEAHLAR